MLVCLICCAAFHFCTLEEYYTGGLFLGPCNGITDGSVGIIVTFIIMGFAGNDFWVTRIGGDDFPRIVDWGVTFFSAVNTGIVFIALKNIFVHQ